MRERERESERVRERERERERERSKNLKEEGERDKDPHQYGHRLADVSQKQCDVAKHEDVAEQDSVHICLALPGKLVFNGSLKIRRKKHNLVSRR